MRTLVALSLLVAAACSGCHCSSERAGGEPESPGDAISGESLVVIDNVRVFDGEAVLEDRRVEIAGETIVAVGDAGGGPEGAEVIDAAGKTLLPGLIDAHTHAFDAIHLEQALVYGVTTELEMLGAPELFADLKAGAAGDAASAELLSAGNAVTAPGGHGTQFVADLDTLDDGDRADEFVARRVEEGSDFIKLVYDDLTGWGMDPHPTLTRDQLGAAIRAAQARDKLAVVHISDASAAADSAELGADGLVHHWVDEPAPQLAEALADAGVFVVPTLSVVASDCADDVASELAGDEGLAAHLAPMGASTLKQSSAELYEITPLMPCDEILASVEHLAREGVVLLAGTDAPNPGTAHGISMHGELALLVRAGLSPVEALRAATAAPADAFGLADRGRIAAGKRADLLLVDGDPTDDIAATRRIAGVWKAGARLDRAAVSDRLASAGADAEAIVAGAISDFEDGTLDSRFGAGWEESPDQVIGGSSTVELEVVDGGAGGADKALGIRGEVAQDEGFAGASFVPGASFYEPVDLSGHEGIALRSRGDGGTYTVMVFTPSNFTSPPDESFAATDAWEDQRFAFEAFADLDPSEVSGIFIGATSPGEFRLEIDDVRLYRDAEKP